MTQTIDLSSVPFQKKDWQGHARQSLSWYDNDKYPKRWIVAEHMPHC